MHGKGSPGPPLQTRSGFPAEMLLVPKKYINLDLANGGAGQAGYDAMEHSPSRHELLHLDIQLLQGVTVQDVDVAPAVYQHAGETGGASVRRKGGRPAWQPAFSYEQTLDAPCKFHSGAKPSNHTTRKCHWLTRISKGEGCCRLHRLRPLGPQSEPCMTSSLTSKQPTSSLQASPKTGTANAESTRKLAWSLPTPPDTCIGQKSPSARAGTTTER